MTEKQPRDRKRSRLSRREFLTDAVRLAGAAGTAGYLAIQFGRETASAASPKRGGTLVIGMESELSSLDPAAIVATSTARAAGNMYQGVVGTRGDKSYIQPVLAQSWTIGEDLQSITMKMRPGVKFHDGTDMTADAVIFSFERMLDHANAYYYGPYAFPDFFFSNYKTATAPDRYTVKFALKQPDVVFLANLCTVTDVVLSPSAVKRLGRTLTSAPTGAGTGPFRFVSWEKNVKTVMERSDTYWGGAPLLDRLIWVPVAEEAERFNRLAGGQLDMVTTLDPQFAPAVTANPDLQLVQTRALHTWWVFFNMHDPRFKDRRVRYAFNHAIDKQAIINSILKGTALLSHSWCWPDTWAYEPNVKLFPYNPTLAKQLLAAAGYPNGFDVDFYVPESGSGMIAPKELAVAIQADLKKVGVNVKITTEEWNTYVASYRQGLDNVHGKQFGMAERSWNNPVDDPGGYADFITTGKSEFGYYENTEYVKLLADARVTADKRKRTELYKHAQRIFAEDAPWIFMFHANSIVAARKNVKGIVLNPNPNQLHLGNVWKA